MKIKERKSVTLVELLIVMAVMGILASIGVAVIPNMQARARNAERVAGMQKLEIALERYYVKNGRYPYPVAICAAKNGVDTVNHGWNGLKEFLVPQYIDRLPNDPLPPAWWGPGNAKYQWILIVSGPTDDHQHYLLQIGLEKSGAAALMKSDKAIVGTVYQAGDVNSYGDSFFFTSGIPDLPSTPAPGPGNQCNAVHLKPLVSQFANCGIFHSATVLYGNLDTGKYYELCVGKIYKEPTRALRSQYPSNWEDPNDPAPWYGIGCLYKFPANPLENQWTNFKVDKCGY